MYIYLFHSFYSVHQENIYLGALQFWDNSNTETLKWDQAKK